MLKNLSKLIENLDECENYIQDVIDKKLIGDPEVGRLINKCMGQFNSEDMSLLEEMINSNFKNAMMTNNLAKLQMAQIHLAEKINSIFSQSLNQYLIN